MTEVRPLNITGRKFLQEIGLTYQNEILIKLRELNLVTWFKIGNKYLYASEDAERISEKLRKKEISIKTDKGYYITIN